MAQSFDFSGKKALVTGGTKGLGLAFVEALIEANIDKVIVVARSEAGLNLIKSRFGDRVQTISVDLSDWQLTTKALQDIEPVHFLINNAGSNVTQDFYNVTAEGFDRVINLNLRSVVNVSQIVCKKMNELGGGAVVNISSQASKKALPVHLSYAASKAGLDAVTRQMAFELAPSIRVNAVNPTVVLTELAKKMWVGDVAEEMLAKIPAGRFAELKDVTGTVLYLLSDAAAMVTGHCLPICGGFSNV